MRSKLAGLIGTIAAAVLVLGLGATTHTADSTQVQRAGGIHVMGTSGSGEGPNGNG